MNLTCVTYTSLARLDLQASDLEDIHRTARDQNALDGVTGLLVFNGTHFLQIIEGSERAIEDLIERLRRSPADVDLFSMARRVLKQAPVHEMVVDDHLGRLEAS